MLGSILAVNIIIIAADLEAGAAAIGLLVGVDWRYFVAPLSVALVPMLLLGGYRRLQGVSLALLLFTLAFAAPGVLACPD